MRLSTAAIQLETVAGPPHGPGERLWRSDNETVARSAFSLYSDDTIHWLYVECQGNGWFRYANDKIGIAWQGGTALFSWHRLRARVGTSPLPCMHGSGVSVESTGVDATDMALLAASQVGKSTLVGALLHDGATFVADDLLALEQAQNGWTLAPGTPAIHLWPDAAKYFCGPRAAELQRVHAQFEKCVADPDADLQAQNNTTGAQLTNFYILDPQEAQASSTTTSINTATAINIEPLCPADALFALVENSFCPVPAKVLGLEATRFQALCEIAKRIPVKRLTIPHDFALLSHVRATPNQTLN